MNKKQNTKIAYALKVLGKEIKKHQKVTDDIDAFNLELAKLSNKFLVTYQVMLLDNYDEVSLLKVFLEKMKVEYMNLYSKYCTNDIKID